MSRRAIRVAPGEMEILGMLWARGPLTIREAHEGFGEFGKPVGYPTMQTRLNRLAEKGLVHRSEERPARYRAVASRDQVSVGHLRELVAKIGR
ncbi:BlaI/MecI/CopY family transcriptional regulator, partial [Singulisphaera rosea]